MARRGFTIHHNGPPARCVGQPHSRCVAFWAAVKRYHVETKGWSDIAYSFGTCPHGQRFVGRGWDKSQWANGTDQVGPYDGRDSEWYTVLVFVGGDASTGDEEAPTAAMIQATADLIAEGRGTGRCGTQVLPHNAFKVKPCPGSAFTALAWQWHNAPLPQEDDPMSMFATIDEFEAAVARAVDNRFATAGTPTRTKLLELLVNNTAAPTAALHQAYVACVKEGIGEPAGPVDVDEAAVAAELAPALLAVLTPQAIADAIPDSLAGDVVDELHRRTAPES